MLAHDAEGAEAAAGMAAFLTCGGRAALHGRGRARVAESIDGRDDIVVCGAVGQADDVERVGSFTGRAEARAGISRLARGAACSGQAIAGIVVTPPGPSTVDASSTTAPSSMVEENEDVPAPEDAEPERSTLTHAELGVAGAGPT